MSQGSTFNADMCLFAWKEDAKSCKGRSQRGLWKLEMPCKDKESLVHYQTSFRIPMEAAPTPTMKDHIRVSLRWW